MSLPPEDTENSSQTVQQLYWKQTQNVRQPKDEDLAYMFGVMLDVMGFPIGKIKNK